MTVFGFHSIATHPLLAPYIEKLSVFESSGKLPAMDKKLIVPNANIKLTITCLNGIIASIADKTFIQNENTVTLSGLIDLPVNLNPDEDIQTRTIVAELNPVGAYRLFRISYSDVKNQIVQLSDLIGNAAERLKVQLTDAHTLDLKLQILQDFLIRQLEKTEPDQIYDYCIGRITGSGGMVSVSQLERETGYSSRWLLSKFSERLGAGPKSLSEIVRFKQFYQVYSSGAGAHSLKQHIYQYYYDQSHFIRAVKKFTGSTLTDLQNSANELASRHYSV